MKILIKLSAIAMILLSMTSCTEVKNPLLSTFDGPFETPPFDLIMHEHYLPAFKAAIDEAKVEIDAIASNNDEPTFANTVEALSYSGEKLSQVSNVFFNLNHAETDERMQQIAREVSPLTTDHYNDILFNEQLFKRIKTVYEQKDLLGLNQEQSMLLEKTYKTFSRNGANLDETKKQKLREISRELSELSLKFSDNVLAETNSYQLHLTDPEQLSGLPQSALDAAAQTAKSKDLDGWVFTLHAPSYVPFMRYADNRDLRREIFIASSTRAYKGNEYDNTEVLTRIANLRLERANLLGYETHADFVLEETMAKDANTVNSFLAELAKASYPMAIKELEDVQQFAGSIGFDKKIQAWDWSYYAEKLRKEKYDFDEELTRPYFKLENVINGVFELTTRLWGLTYKPNDSIPLYHPDVKTYEVYNVDNRFLGVLYLDFFPREGKNAGAWMTAYREQYRKDGKDHRPHVSLVCNFSKPTENSPSLLTFNEFVTYLHEFGHGLHGLLSDVTYTDLSGTSVYRDFVELPSQIMENWAIEKEFLDLFARHYETGEPIPAEMVEKIKMVRNFHAAYATVRQLSFGLNDMAWHSIKEPVTIMSIGNHE
jgi:peptidyl-dipeptidase Dcp